MPTSEELEKHAARLHAWLPACRRRLENIRRVHGSEAFIRYFTYSSGDAVDPIFLFKNRILSLRSETGIDPTQGLTAVHLFNRLADNPQYASLDLPGARCFGGPFLQTVLLDIDAPSPYEPDSDAGNKYAVLQASHRRFRQYFPFDIVNIDWNELVFDAEGRPMIVVEALQRLFEWQAAGGDSTRNIDAFALTFSSRRPTPGEVSIDSRSALRDAINSNITSFPQLADLLESRFSTRQVEALIKDQWNGFIELGTIKVILKALLDSGWVVDPSQSPHIIERQTNDGGRITQLVLEVIRAINDQAVNGYTQSVERIFQNGASTASPGSLGTVRNSLSDVFQLRAAFREGPSRL